jgi:hypothetical protein
MVRIRCTVGDPLRDEGQVAVGNVRAAEGHARKPFRRPLQDLEEKRLSGCLGTTGVFP